MHVFPQLRKLEKKYQRELVVVGVHSAKFQAERSTDNIRKAILRYEIEHPVVNDRDFALWQQYTVSAWPTIMVIDPQGNVLGKHEGEVPFEAFDQLIGEMVKQFEEKGLINRAPLEFKLEKVKEPPSPLSFPGKVLADEKSGKLFISDSNHNRIIVASLEGSVQELIGSGQEGLSDGSFASASFNHPQGVAIIGDILYVADTENHALRRVDLTNKRVATIGGTGEQATLFHAGGQALQVALNSPWDLVVHKDTLYIAMAGFHQLWALNLTSNEVYPHSGSGREGIADGSRMHAHLAQPSGIATDGERLYFADSETSSIRSVTLGGDGRVETVIGVGLFEFGDRDGVGDAVRLQHPLGICLHDGGLYVADTYNNKIKQVYPRTRGSTSFLGTGEPGHRDGEGYQATFSEPGGLSIARGQLYIADTNNHSIRIADLSTKEVRTLDIEGL